MPLTDPNHANAGDLVKTATAGGLGSILGGGKFLNGAVTGAMGYMFNHEAEGEGESESENTRGGLIEDDPAQTRIDNYYSLRAQLKELDPTNAQLSILTGPNWVPTSGDVEALTVEIAKIRADRYAEYLEEIGGGKPRIVPTPKGARQFIFPNGTILRFDLAPGQYLNGQVPHINLQNIPEHVEPNIHIDLRPNP